MHGILDVRDEHLYLGVLLHKSLSWSNHIAKTTVKASQLFNFLRRNLSNCSPSVKASSLFWSMQHLCGIHISKMTSYPLKKYNEELHGGHYLIMVLSVV